MTLPTLAVVCNLYNEERRVPEILRLLEAQELTDFRVIMVDDGSTDATRDLLRNYRGPLNLDLLELPHVGLAPARLRGLQAVDEEVAVVVDADMTFHPGWLRAVARRFAENPRLGGLFSRVSYSGDAPLARGAQAVREAIYWIRRRSGRPWMAGAGMALRTEAIRQTTFTAGVLTAEDLDLSERLIEAGWEIAGLDRPPITTMDPVTHRDLLRRHFRVGRRTVHLLRAHPRFLLRPSNLGRFFPGIALLGFAIDLWAGLVVEVAMLGTLTLLMRLRRVDWRSTILGWWVFHVQTAASLAGLIVELVFPLRPQPDGPPAPSS